GGRGLVGGLDHRGGDPRRPPPRAGRHAGRHRLSGLDDLARRSRAVPRPPPHRGRRDAPRAARPPGLRGDGPSLRDGGGVKTSERDRPEEHFPPTGDGALPTEPGTPVEPAAAREPQTAIGVLRRGLRESPELRRGLAFTIALALASAIGRLFIPILLQ